MGPWSADLPDVSPPEKQLACQRARLYLNTHSNMLRSCVRAGAQALMQKTFGSKLWLDMTRRRKKKRIKRGAFLNVMSIAGLLLVGFRADWLAGWLA